VRRREGGIRIWGLRIGNDDNNSNINNPSETSRQPQDTLTVLEGEESRAHRSERRAIIQRIVQYSTVGQYRRGERERGETASRCTEQYCIQAEV